MSPISTRRHAYELLESCHMLGGISRFSSRQVIVPLPRVLAVSPAPNTPSGNREPNGVAPPTLSLPKPGGALRGIGEKFSTNPLTGTGSMAVPIATSPGRAGFGPELTLTYDSGRGNGPFGFGWDVSLPAITRKTDQGLPRYADAEESDVFIFVGAEDLVPMLDAKNGWKRLVLNESTHAPGYRIERFRPRTEGLFARIERWIRTSDGDVHWRSVTRENVTTRYGEDSSSRITDPHDETRVYQWLASQSYDDKGNAMVVTGGKFALRTVFTN
jgi:hypothetical protein